MGQLEAAAEILRRDGGDPVTPAPDLAGSTIDRAGLTILGESPGEWLHYRDIACQAMDRGYKSKRYESDSKKVTRSFFDIMKRNPAVERDGPRFRLRQ